MLDRGAGARIFRFGLVLVAVAATGAGCAGFLGIDYLADDDDASAEGSQNEPARADVGGGSSAPGDATESPDVSAGQGDSTSDGAEPADATAPPADGGGAETTIDERDASAGDEGDGESSRADAPATPDAAACTAGDVASCAEDSTGKPIPGLVATVDGIGVCTLGRKACADGGAWGPCVGAVGPSPRDCESHQDLNCDGLPDDTIDSVCQCNSAHPTVPCTGSNNCPGTRSCDANHQLSACSAPAECMCTPDTTQDCSGGPNNCPGGTQACTSSNTWGDCTGAPTYCDCTAGQTRACSATSGAWPCGLATCSNGQWDTTPCTPPVSWCQDLDGDGFCSTTCVMGCTGPANTKSNCPSTPALTDCDDNNPSINPNTPADCTAATSCVKQSILYSASAGACTCITTSAPANNGTTCATYSICSNGACTCDQGAPCALDCRSGNVNCILGPSCQTIADAPAATPCGAAAYCNGSGACWTNCILGMPKCDIGSCVAGSTSFVCNEGTFCDVTYVPDGGACLGPPGICDGKGNCQFDGG